MLASEAFGVEDVLAAVRALGQDPERPLRCVYCGDPASHLDHAYAVGTGGRGARRGYRLRNQVPACGACDTAKLGLDWDEFFASPCLVGRDERTGGAAARESRRALVEKYVTPCAEDAFVVKEVAAADCARLREMEVEIVRLCKEADALAKRIRRSVEGNAPF